MNQSLGNGSIVSVGIKMEAAGIYISRQVRDHRQEERRCAIIAHIRRERAAVEIEGVGMSTGTKPTGNKVARRQSAAVQIYRLITRRAAGGIQDVKSSGNIECSAVGHRDRATARHPGTIADAQGAGI